MRENTMDDNAIFDALRDLGLTYERRLSTRGVPYAGFRLVGGAPMPDVAVTAFVEEGVLRLTSHGIATSASALDILRRGARLPLGAAYRAPEDDAAHLSVGVWIGDAAVPAELVSRLLAYLVQATAALVDRGPAPTLVDVRDLGMGRAIDIPAALAQHGHRLTPEGDGFRLDLSLSSTVACSIVLREVGEGWLSASATYAPERQVPDDPQSMRELQRLQRWATAGRLVLGDDLALRAEVMTPMLDASARAVVWTTSQAVALLQAAARYLPLTS